MKKNQYIKDVSAEELSELVASNADHFQLLNSLRNYVGLTIVELTGAEASSSKYTSFYSLKPSYNNHHAFVKSSPDNLLSYLNGLEEAAKESPDVDMQLFKKVRAEIVQRYGFGYAQNNKTILRDAARREREVLREAEEEEKAEQRLDKVLDANGYFDLLRALREYFGLTLEGCGKILNPEKPPVSERVRQYEDKDHLLRNILPEECLHRLVADYRTRLEEDDFLLRDALTSLEDLWLEEYRSYGQQISQKVRYFADAESDNLNNYLTYLVIEAGYSPGGIGFGAYMGRESAFKLSENLFGKLIERLRDAHPDFGREITLEEIERAQELFFEERRLNGNRAEKKGFSQSFADLVAENAGGRLNPPASLNELARELLPEDYTNWRERYEASVRAFDDLAQNLR